MKLHAVALVILSHSLVLRKGKEVVPRAVVGRGRQRVAANSVDGEPHHRRDRRSSGGGIVEDKEIVGALLVAVPLGPKAVRVAVQVK